MAVTSAKSAAGIAIGANPRWPANISWLAAMGISSKHRVVAPETPRPQMTGFDVQSSRVLCGLVNGNLLRKFSAWAL
jgi:hypothetical protein